MSATTTITETTLQELLRLKPAAPTLHLDLKTPLSKKVPEAVMGMKEAQLFPQEAVTLFLKLFEQLDTAEQMGGKKLSLLLGFLICEVVWEVYANETDPAKLNRIDLYEQMLVELLREALPLEVSVNDFLNNYELFAQEETEKREGLAQLSERTNQIALTIIQKTNEIFYNINSSCEHLQAHMVEVYAKSQALGNDFQGPQLSENADQVAQTLQKIYEEQIQITQRMAQEKAKYEHNARLLEGVLGQILQQSATLQARIHDLIHCIQKARIVPDEGLDFFVRKTLEFNPTEGDAPERLRLLLGYLYSDLLLVALGKETELNRRLQIDRFMKEVFLLLEEILPEGETAEQFLQSYEQYREGERVDRARLEMITETSNGTRSTIYKQANELNGEINTNFGLQSRRVLGVERERANMTRAFENHVELLLTRSNQNFVTLQKLSAEQVKITDRMQQDHVQYQANAKQLEALLISRM